MKIRCESLDVANKLAAHDSEVRFSATLEFGEVNLWLLRRMTEVGLWPKAVDDRLIIRGDAGRRNRAAQLVGFAGVTTGKRFLDWGCGDGDAVAEATRRGALAVGYDPNSTAVGVITDLDEAIRRGPYDVVLAYDSLDHSTTPVEDLKAIRSVLAERGSVRVRCHPFSAIHGGHLYESENLAYLHLLRDLPHGHPRPVLRPLMTYSGWFSEAGLRVIGEPEVHKVELPDQLNDPGVLAALRNRWWSDDEFVQDDERFKVVLRIAFVDYWLSA